MTNKELYPNLLDLLQQIIYTFIYLHLNYKYN